MAYGDFKDLPRRTVADNALCDKAFNIAKNKTFYGYQHRIASMVYIYFFEKTFSGSGFTKNKLKN